MPVLELTTTGRKAGEPHPVLLTTPVREGDVLVVVATKMGHDHHPAWFLNLRENPDVEVVSPFPGGPVRSMRARVADPEDRAQLWPRIVQVYQGYAKYQAKTDRELPVVLLEPVDTSSATG